MNKEARIRVKQKEYGTEKEIVEVVKLSEEDLYTKEFELIIDEYMAFTSTYRSISKQMMNPIKMRKNVNKIYEDLNKLSKKFNRSISDFKERAVPCERFVKTHQRMLRALDYFEIYNDEFPDLMISGNFKRINELSKGLELGHQEIRCVFEEIEKIESNHKEKQ